MSKRKATKGAMDEKVGASSPRSSPPSATEERKGKKKGGRPAVITAAVVEEVAALMSTGVPEEFACSLCGVNPETYGPAVSRSPELKAIARKHHAKFIAESMDIIRKGGEVIEVVEGHDENGPIVKEKVMPWTGRAWILERRYKPHFTKTEVVKDRESKGEGGGLFNAADLEEIEKTAREMFVKK